MAGFPSCHLRVSMFRGQLLKHSDQFDRLASNERDALLHLQHRGTVLYILGSSSPVDVLRMLGRYHRCQLLN
jgi:hypothetical protein